MMKLFQTSPRILLNENSRIIINIWLPRVNGEISTTAQYIQARYNQQLQPALLSRIGHVSINTPNKYASWGPDPAHLDQISVFNKVPAINNSYVQDIHDEGSLPDVRVTLYSLNVIKIEQLFEQIENSPYGYVLAGDKTTTRLLDLFGEQKGQSCSGLAYELLEEGGVLALSSLLKDLTIKWVVTSPENFCEFIKNAKRKELEQYPETQIFNPIENEYVPEQIKSFGCSIS